MSDEWFDDLTKRAAQGMSRRQVFARLLGGAGLAGLTLFGLRLRRNTKDCGQLCEVCCHNAFPHGGREFGQCVSDCQHGQGICGPIVCPGG